MRLDLMHAGYETSSADSDFVSSAGNSEGNAVIQMRDVFFKIAPFGVFVEHGAMRAGCGTKLAQSSRRWRLCQPS